MQMSLAVKATDSETKIDHTHRGISGSHEGRPRWERSCQTSAPTVGWTSSSVAVTTPLRCSSHSDQPHQSASVGWWWGDSSLITPLSVWLQVLSIPDLVRIVMLSYGWFMVWIVWMHMSDLVILLSNCFVKSQCHLTFRKFSFWNGGYTHMEPLNNGSL